MRILSLFDGISCGQLALTRAGIPIEIYYASEIDKYAMQVTQKNFPKTIQLGDVSKIDFTQFVGKIDMIIGGSPCQDLSIAKANRQGLQGQRSGLFYKFVEAIRTIKPKYFLLENVASMSKENRDIITKELGVEPIMINSALVSAQQRKRLYWCNWKIEQPKDKGIILKDILEKVTDSSQTLTSRYGVKGLCYDNDKAKTLTASCYKGYGNDGCTLVAEPLVVPEATKKGFVEIKPNECVDLTQLNSKTRRGRAMKDKSNCLTCQSQFYQYIKPSDSMVCQPICVDIPETVTIRQYEVDVEKLKKVLREHKKLTNKEIAEKLQQPITKVEHWFRTDDSFAIPDSNIWPKLKELLNIQTDEFDKSIMCFKEKINTYDKTNRKYSVNGKMSTLMAKGNDEIIQPISDNYFRKFGSKGKILNENTDKSNTLTASAGTGGGNVPAIAKRVGGFYGQNTRWGIYSETGKSPTLTASMGLGGGHVPMTPVRLGQVGKGHQGERVYSVKGKSICLSGDGGGKAILTKIDLPDGEYIIRKLTPIECERLQTLPDNYTECVSKTQRYKAIGNGWTVDVIAHMFRELQKNKTDKKENKWIPMEQLEFNFGATI